MAKQTRDRLLWHPHHKHSVGQSQETLHANATTEGASTLEAHIQGTGPRSSSLLPKALTHYFSVGVDWAHPDCGGRDGEGRVEAVQVEYQRAEVTRHHAAMTRVPGQGQQPPGNFVFCMAPLRETGTHLLQA